MADSLQDNGCGRVDRDRRKPLIALTGTYGSPGRRSLRRHWLIGTPFLLALAAVIGRVSGEIVAFALLGPTLFALLLYDARYLILPDSLVALVFITGLGYSGLSSSAPVALDDAVIGIAAGGGALWGLRGAHARLRGVTGLGLGDVKLFAAAGAWVGWQGLPDLLLVACLATLGAIGAERLRTKNKPWRRLRMPFGPGLVIALYVWVLMPAVR